MASKVQSRVFSTEALRSLARPELTYFICTNPRSGSWLLSEALASTELAGNPREWFNPYEEKHQRTANSRWIDAAFSSYFRHAIGLATTLNGICGIKIHYYQFILLIKQLRSFFDCQEVTRSELIKVAFPNTRFVWLSRENKERQALSYYKARQTNQWWLLCGREVKPNATMPDAHIDLEDIWRLENLVRNHEDRWASFFSEANLTPLRMSYEHLCGAYEETVREILRWLGIPEASSVIIPAPRLQRQSDQATEDHLALYSRFKAQQAAMADSGYST
jgi:LPS sulfotransferase NodH